MRVAEAKINCRFDNEAQNDKPLKSYRDFCAFEFPACAGCPLSAPMVASVAPTEDPMSSDAWRWWAMRASVAAARVS